MGFADKKEKYQNPDIKTLSTKQKQLNIDMNSTNSLARRDQLRQERKRLLTEIHNMIRLVETNKIERKLHNIENTPDDSRRMFQAIKTIKNIKPRKPLLMQSQAGLTANEEEQCKIIAEHFKIQFHKNA